MVRFSCCHLASALGITCCKHGTGQSVFVIQVSFLFKRASVLNIQQSTAELQVKDMEVHQLDTKEAAEYNAHHDSCCVRPNAGYRRRHSNKAFVMRISAPLVPGWYRHCSHCAQIRMHVKVQVSDNKVNGRVGWTKVSADLKVKLHHRKQLLWSLEWKADNGERLHTWLTSHWRGGWGEECTKLWHGKLRNSFTRKKKWAAWSWSVHKMKMSEEIYT